MAARFWRATCLYKLESPQSRARIAADWLLELFYAPTATEIRSREYPQALSRLRPAHLPACAAV